MARVLFVAGLAVTTSACLLAVSTTGLSAVDAAAAEASDGSAEATNARDARDASDPPEADATAAGDGRTLPPNAKTFPCNGHVYALVIVPSWITWNEARTRAEEAGGHLATIGSAGENGFVIGLADQSFGQAFTVNGVGPWLGARQPSPNGANEPAGGWEWIDGTPWARTGAPPSPTTPEVRSTSSISSGPQE